MKATYIDVITESDQSKVTSRSMLRPLWNVRIYFCLISTHVCSHMSTSSNLSDISVNKPPFVIKSPSNALMIFNHSLFLHFVNVFASVKHIYQLEPLTMCPTEVYLPCYEIKAKTSSSHLAFISFY